MTLDDWQHSDDAASVLLELHDRQPEFFTENLSHIHRFLIACCWKNARLTPQNGLREGLTGAESWLKGGIDDDELYRLNWHAEGDVFRLDYAAEPDEIDEIKAMISGIPGLDEMPFDEARELLTRAAHFAEVTIVFQSMRPKPRAWLSIISEYAEFLCADILRDHVKPKLD